MSNNDLDFEIEILENTIPFSSLVFRKHPLYDVQASIKREITAFDTETLYGYCRLLAESNGNYILDKNVDGILDFLTMKRYETTHNFFYNLNYDVNAIIKFLPLPQLTELKNDNITAYKDYDLFYIPKKIFKIKKGHHTFNYYDIAQFYGMSLDKASKKFLNENKYKDNFIDIDGETLGTSRRYWYDNMDTIIEYCLNDCVLTKKLSELLQNKKHETIGIYPKRYISKASITKDYVRQIVNYPKIQFIPTKAMNYAFNSYSGGRFEIAEKGNVDECSLVDLVSAYPHHIKNLIDVTRGKWKRVTDMHENAYYGYYLVSLITKYNKISPISYYLKNGTLCYPIIDCVKYMTKSELLNYEKYIEYEIINGWEFYPEEIVYPFKDYIENLFFWKTKSSCLNASNDCNKIVCENCNSFEKNPNKSYEYDLFKIFMNAFYGITYEKVKKRKLDIDKLMDMTNEEKLKLKTMPMKYEYLTGKFFNPIYATEITSGTQIDLFNCAMKDINNFVGFATDSILFKGKPDMEFSRKLGGWELEKTGNTIVVKSGIYQIKDKIQSRGMKKTENLKTEFGEFKNIIEYIRGKPELLNYPVILKNPITFKKVLQCHKKYNIEDINLFIEEIYNIDINKDYKRQWNGTFEAGIELLNHSIESKPVMLC